MKAVLAGMSGEAAAAKSRAACAAAVALEEYANATVLMLYAPIQGETDCTAIARAAWRDGKTVLLPKVRPAQRQMIAVACRSLEETVVGAYGIREPAGNEPWPIEDIDFIVVPALAYDRKGNRLGRGGGFYDRFLAGPGLRAVTCGLAFAEQLVEELPVQPNDYPVDIVVTDLGISRFKPGPIAASGMDHPPSVPAAEEEDP